MSFARCLTESCRKDGIQNGGVGSEFFSRYFQIIITLFSEVVGKGKRVKLFVTLLSLICL